MFLKVGPRTSRVALPGTVVGEQFLHLHASVRGPSSLGWV